MQNLTFSIKKNQLVTESSATGGTSWHEDRRMSGEMVGQVLDRALNGTQGPRSITVDYGTEFQSRALEDWAYRRGVQLDFIRLSKSQEMSLLNRLTADSATSV